MHLPERAAWEAAIQDSKLWQELKLRECLTTEWGGHLYYLLADLVEIAVKFTADPIYGKFSSQTFGRYAREDRFDTLELLKLSGRWWVRLLNPAWALGKEKHPDSTGKKVVSEAKQGTLTGTSPPREA